ncbi:MAG: patatin family protein [Clostridia bacterium]|nr:patatin family protein [Clostridia bacterium]MBQ2236638.1 patatin family protein [Clostridia bacterium]MEE1185019.1 patatin family protein [Acutalibacteraceae bacterium]
MKTGLVLEGGAMRGMFTAGVIDVLLENGIELDGAIGVSAGAVFGCNYKSKQAGRVIRYNMRFARDKRYCSFRSLFKTGNLYGEKLCYHDIPEKLDVFDVNTYKNSPMEFYVVCTDVLTGKAVYKKCEEGKGEDIEWMRASASMPLVSTVVEVEGYKLLDGGVADSIPLKFFESIGYERNIVVLTQPNGYIKGENKTLPIAKWMLRKYPNLLSALEKRHVVYNETLEYVQQRETQGAILVIRPESALDIGHIEHNPDNMKRVYEIGRQTAQKHLEDIKKFLGESLLKN